MSHKNKVLSRFKKLIGIICLITFFLLFAIHLKDRNKKTLNSTISPRPVQTALSIQKNIPVYIETFGTLSSLDNVDIKSQVTGKIKEVHFKEGDKVSKGDLLFTVGPEEFKTNLNKAKAALNQDNADLEFKKDTLKRNKSLIANEYISEQEFEKYKTDVEIAQSKVHLDKAVFILEEIILKYCYICSPINGVTGKLLIDPGNIVPANNGPALVNIKTTDSLNVDFTISERYLPKLRTAMAKAKLKVNIYIDEDKNSPYFGELSFLDNTVDVSSGTIGLTAIVSNKQDALWPGQFVSVRLILGITENAVLVPYEAIQFGQNGPYLFTVNKNNQAELHQVETGQKYNDTIEITKGVGPKETIVTAGQMGLSPQVFVINIDQQKQNNPVKQ